MDILAKERKLRELEKQLNELGDNEAVEKIKKEIKRYKEKEMTKLSAWDRVLLARHQLRPTAIDYISYMSSDFIELRGDRLFRDDKSIIGGIGTIDGQVFTIIAHQKGRTLEDNIERNFAMPHPEGYRKALRLMKQAEKFKRPIITIIDTPGAFPGIGAEVMKLTSYDLEEFNIIDGIIKEPLGGAHFDKEKILIDTKQAIMDEFYKLRRLSPTELHYQRNNKVRNYGFLQRFNYDNLGGIKR